MKPKVFLSITVALAAALGIRSTSQGATLTWDPGLSGTGATFGSGTWDNTTPIWSNGATDTTYVSASDAVFGGTSAGTATVNLSSAQNANSVTINSSGYAFTGSALTISGTFATAPGFTVAANMTASMSNALNFTNGAGVFSNMGLGNGSTLTLTGGGTVGGTFKVSSAANNGGVTTGTLNLNGGTFTPGAMWTQCTVNQGAATVTTGTTFVGYAGNSTYTMNNAAAVYNVTGGQAMYLGRAATTGTFVLQSGALNLTGAGGFISAGFRDNGSTGVLSISGGTLSAAANTVYLVDAFNGATANGYTGAMTMSAGTATVAGVTFYGASNNAAPATVFSGTNQAALNVSGGTLYIGAGGLTLSTTTSGTRTAAINLSGGTLGATAAWSSSMNMTLTNTGGGVTFRAADSTSAAQNITLTGVLGGAGGLTKTGAGILTLSGTNTYTGTTVVLAGALTLTGTATVLSDSSILSLVAGTTLNLNAAAGTSETIQSLILDGVTQPAGTYTAAQLTSRDPNITFASANGETLTVAVPEPSSLLVALVGLAVFFGLRARFKGVARRDTSGN